MLACARPSWLRLPDLPSVSLPTIGRDSSPEAGRVSEVEVVDSAEVADFYARATEFYRRLEGRRFNSIVSFRDAGLRAYFENDQTFTDYYAAVADELATAHCQADAIKRDHRPVAMSVTLGDIVQHNGVTAPVRRGDRWLYGERFGNNGHSPLTSGAPRSARISLSNVRS